MLSSGIIPSVKKKKLDLQLQQQPQKQQEQHQFQLWPHLQQQHQAQYSKVVKVCTFISKFCMEMLTASYTSVKVFRLMI